MTERVYVKRDFREYSEFLEKIFFAEKYLPYHAFAGRHIAIGLKIPPAYDFPLTPFYKLANLFKQFRGVSFNVFVNGHFVMAENKIMLFKQFFRRSERCHRSACAFLPIPLPDWINVCVAN